MTLINPIQDWLQNNWPLLIAIILILLKQLFKLHVHHKPDGIDYLKALTALPIDISFLVISLFIKAATLGTMSSINLMGWMISYLATSFVITILWRICDKQITTKPNRKFYLIFPFNAGLSGCIFYTAIHVLG